MRTRFPDSPVAAQSAPSPYVSAFTVAPSLTLLTTSPRSVSFQSVPPGLTALQTNPPPAATQQSQPPKSRAALVTTFEAGSMRDSFPITPPPTHSAPLPNAIASAPPSGMTYRRCTSPLAASNRQT